MISILFEKFLDVEEKPVFRGIIFQEDIETGAKSIVDIYESSDINKLSQIIASNAEYLLRSNLDAPVYNVEEKAKMKIILLNENIDFGKLKLLSSKCRKILEQI